MKKKEARNLLKFLFEAGELKRVKRSGWWTAKVPNPESVAEHSFRCAIIAFVLASEEENGNADKLAVLSLFHDLPEARILDLHKISTTYIDKTEAEKKVAVEQFSLLPKKSAKNIPAVQKTSEKERRILKDADLLECAIQAREYFDAGCKDAWYWILAAERKMSTESAKQLVSLLKKTNSNIWWEKLREKIVNGNG